MTKPTITKRPNGSLQIIVPKDNANAGTSPVPVVNVTTLQQVVSEWGNEIDQPLVSHKATQTPVPPPVPPPPVGTLERIDSQMLGTTAVTFDRKHIVGDIPIEGPLGKTVDCVVKDSKIEGQQYGAIISSGRLEIHRTPIRVTGNKDNCYGIRLWGDGRPFKMIGTSKTELTTIDNRPGFKRLLRISNFLGGEIACYKLIGSGSWIGTGPSDHSGPPNCGPLWIHDCEWYTIVGDATHALEYFENTHDITVERVNFYLAPGYDVLNAWTDKPNCRGHRFIGCTVTLVDPNTLQPTGQAVPLGWQHIRGGAAKNAVGITITN